MTNFETRLMLLKESWAEIQEMREERSRARKTMQKAQKKVRELSQLIPRKLDEYNKQMV